MSYFILCAGGTGGHLFPAQALCETLQRRGHSVDLMTDERADTYGVSFPARATHMIPSATFSPRAPLKALPSLLTIGRGFVKAFTLMGRQRPAAIIGFGGYPTLPSLLAARARGVPIILHEQNAVLGRANALMATHAAMIATSFAQIDGLPGKGRAKVVQTGNPVRAQVIEAAKAAYVAPQTGGHFNLLVFGGSQGARVFADLVPGALEQLDPEMRARIHVTQQCRAEDISRVRDAYEVLGVGCDLGAFFVDMPQRMAASHLVIARSGASSVAELCAVGRPAILVPYPHALDHDQARNAERMEALGGAILTLQKNIGPVRLAQLLARLMDASSSELVAMAAASRQAGRPDAVELLAAEVEALVA